MANISDEIEKFLLSVLGSDDTINISRNDLANYFSCAPSQINYVLTTRFTPDRGFNIESKRGGGGYVSVMRVTIEPDSFLQEILSRSSSDGMSFVSASQILDRLVAEELITAREATLLKASVTDKALIAPSVIKDGLRASIMKSVITQILSQI